MRLRRSGPASLQRLPANRCYWRGRGSAGEWRCCTMRKFGRVAQLVRAPASHAGGHRFESCRAHHSNQSLIYVVFWSLWSIYRAFPLPTALFSPFLRCSKAVPHHRTAFSLRDDGSFSGGPSQQVLRQFVDLFDHTLWNRLGVVQGHAVLWSRLGFSFVRVWSRTPQHGQLHRQPAALGCESQLRAKGDLLAASLRR